MDNPLLRKLENYVRLPEADKHGLHGALGTPRRVEARAGFVLEGDHPRGVHVILEGWACHYKQLDDGRQQIVSILLPGDSCDPHVVRLDRMDYGLAAITAVTVAQIPGKAILEMTRRSPTLDEAFHRQQLVSAAVLREWLASLGRRSAIERLAHLFCELHLRQTAIGLADGSSCPMPLTQNDLADALGQTSVHINRTIQDLRHAGLIVLKSRRLTILDEAALRRLAHFDPAYLHLDLADMSADPKRVA